MNRFVIAAVLGLLFTSQADAQHGYGSPMYYQTRGFVMAGPSHFKGPTLEHGYIISPYSVVYPTPLSRVGMMPSSGAFISNVYTSGFTAPVYGFSYYYLPGGFSREYEPLATRPPVWGW